jgi:hypothetical protein
MERLAVAFPSGLGGRPPGVAPPHWQTSATAARCPVLPGTLRIWYSPVLSCSLLAGPSCWPPPSGTDQFSSLSAAHPPTAALGPNAATHHLLTHAGMRVPASRRNHTYRMLHMRVPLLQYKLNSVPSYHTSHHVGRAARHKGTQVTPGAPAEHTRSVGNGRATRAVLTSNSATTPCKYYHPYCGEGSTAAVACCACWAHSQAGTRPPVQEITLR